MDLFYSFFYKENYDHLFFPLNFHLFQKNFYIPNLEGINQNNDNENFINTENIKKPPHQYNFEEIKDKLDEEKNKVKGEEEKISSEDSKIDVYVIPTNEELMIARETMKHLGQR